MVVRWPRNSPVGKPGTPTHPALPYHLASSIRVDPSVTLTILLTVHMEAPSPRLHVVPRLHPVEDPFHCSAEEKCMRCRHPHRCKPHCRCRGPKQSEANVKSQLRRLWTAAEALVFSLSADPQELRRSSTTHDTLTSISQLIFFFTSQQ